MKPLASSRRRFARRLAAAALSLGPLAPLLAARPARAAEARLRAFEARQLADALAALDAASAPTGAIRIETPDIAENGALVPLTVTSEIPATRTLQLLVDRNPIPLLLSLELAAEVRPRFETRIRMAESSAIRVLARTGAGACYTATRKVGVTVGGCGS